MPATESHDEANSFAQTLFRLQHSSTYSRFCDKVYGRNLCQLNVLDEEQLQSLVGTLNLTPNHSVLDLGCGAGYISEYLSDTTGAIVTGLDFAEEVVKAARERTKAKSRRLKFVEGNLNSLSFQLGKFDFILSVDTLCFSEDLLACLKQVRSLLKPGGQFAAFCSYTYKDTSSKIDLDPKTSKYGLALSDSGFAFQAMDYSQNERAIWEKALRVANKLKENFEAEGNAEIYEGRISEAKRTLKFIADGRRARAFYLADAD